MITINFKKGEKEKDISGLWQYDYGRSLVISGLELPELVKIEFSLHDRTGETIPRTGITTDGLTVVAIPNELLANEGCYTDYCIYAFIYIEDETKGCTHNKIKLRVRSRTKPGDYDVPDQAPDYVIGQIGKLSVEIAGKITAPETAEVGQAIVVEEVDENGKPTKWSAEKFPTKLSDLENDLFYTKRELFLSLTKDDFTWDEYGNGYYYTDKQDWFTGADKIGFDWYSTFLNDDGSIGECSGTEKDGGGLVDDYESSYADYGCWNEEWVIGFYNGTSANADGEWEKSDKFMVFLSEWKDYTETLDLKIYHIDEKKVPIEYCDTSEIEAEIDNIIDEVNAL